MRAFEVCKKKEQKSAFLRLILNKANKVYLFELQFFFFYLVAYLSSYHQKAIKALYELA